MARTAKLFRNADSHLLFPKGAKNLVLDQL
jgi:hypothetical protein